MRISLPRGLEPVVNWETLARLGSTIRRARLARRWTQQELADRADLDQTSISLVERGQFPGLRLILFVRIARALGLDLEALAPREVFVVDPVVEALRIARLEAEGRVCPACRSILRTPIPTNRDS